MTREEALSKIKAAKLQKKQAADKIIKRMTKQFIQDTGKSPKYIEVW